jgi:hypothetical protein
MIHFLRLGERTNVTSTDQTAAVAPGADWDDAAPAAAEPMLSAAELTEICEAISQSPDLPPLESPIAADPLAADPLAAERLALNTAQLQLCFDPPAGAAAADRHSSGAAEPLAASLTASQPVNESVDQPADESAAHGMPAIDPEIIAADDWGNQLEMALMANSDSVPSLPIDALNDTPELTEDAAPVPETAYAVRTEGPLTYFQYFLEDRPDAAPADYPVRGARRSPVPAALIGAGVLSATVITGLAIADALKSPGTSQAKKPPTPERGTAKGAERKPLTPQPSSPELLPYPSAMAAGPQLPPPLAPNTQLAALPPPVAGPTPNYSIQGGITLKPMALPAPVPIGPSPETRPSVPVAIVPTPPVEPSGPVPEIVTDPTPQPQIELPGLPPVAQIELPPGAPVSNLPVSNLPAANLPVPSGAIPGAAANALPLLSPLPPTGGPMVSDRSRPISTGALGSSPVPPGDAIPAARPLPIANPPAGPIGAVNSAAIPEPNLAPVTITVDRPIAAPIRATSLIERPTPAKVSAEPAPLVQALLTSAGSATARSLSQAEAAAVSQTSQLGQFTKQVLAVQPYLQAWRTASQNATNGAIPSFGFVDYQRQLIVLVQEDPTNATPGSRTQAMGLLAP